MSDPKYFPTGRFTTNFLPISCSHYYGWLRQPRPPAPASVSLSCSRAPFLAQMYVLNKVIPVLARRHSSRKDPFDRQKRCFNPGTFRGGKLVRLMQDFARVNLAPLYGHYLRVSPLHSTAIVRDSLAFLWQRRNPSARRSRVEPDGSTRPISAQKKSVKLQPLLPRPN